jgi:hypothetical protein
MASFTKFNQFVQDLATKKHDLSADVFKVMLTNSAPSASNAIKADITDISAGNGYTAGGNTAADTSCTQTSGTLKMICASPATWTASGGTIGPFRYAVMYNDTQATPAKPLVGYWDYGSSVTLAIGETFSATLDGTNGVLQIA